MSRMLLKGLFWGSVVVIHTLTWLLVGLASWIVPQFWREQPAGRGANPWRDRWHNWLYGDGDRRRSYRKRLLDVNAFYWLASRVRLKPLGVWAFVGFIACWWVIMVLRLDSKWFDESLSFTTALMISSVLKLWIAIEACQRLAEDRKIGALELLLSTPLSVKDILYGQLLALRRQFLMPVMVAIFAGWLLIVAGGERSFEENARLQAFGIAGIVMLVCDITALIWVAMAAALTVKNPNRASVRTIFQVLILPWLFFLAVSALVGTGTFSSSAKPSWKFYLVLWFNFGILADIAFGFAAWNQLRTRFRSLAFERLSVVRVHK